MVIASFGLPFVWTDPAFEDWALMAGMGVMGGLSHYCLIQAYTRAPPSVLAPFSYTQIVMGTIVGYLWFGDFPDAVTITGTLIIIACGLYLIWREAGGRDDMKAPRG
jgi:drug/metabolite transporter (DMT)-like permease